MQSKNILAFAVAVALAAPGLVSADPFTVNYNGTPAGGTLTGVTGFDWAPSNIITVGATTGAAGVGGNQAIANQVINDGSGSSLDTSFQVLGQGTLGNFNGIGGQSNGGLGQGGSYEWTYQFGFGETVTSLTGPTAFFGFAAADDSGTPFENFFDIYYNPSADSSDLLGTGFGAGGGNILIYHGSFTGDLGDAGNTPIFGNYTASPANAGDIDQSANGCDPAWTGFGGAGTGGCTETVGGAGTQSNLEVSTIDFNADFFPDVASLDFTLLQNVSQALPFAGLDPSLAFTYSSSYLVAPVALTTTAGFEITSFNGELTFPGGVPTPTGTGFQFQTDFNSTVSATNNVPAPTSLVLMGLGLGALGAWRRRSIKA